MIAHNLKPHVLVVDMGTNGWEAYCSRLCLERWHGLGNMEDVTHMDIREFEEKFPGEFYCHDCGTDLFRMEEYPHCQDCGKEMSVSPLSFVTNGYTLLSCDNSECPRLSVMSAGVTTNGVLNSCYFLWHAEHGVDTVVGIPEEARDEYKGKYREVRGFNDGVARGLKHEFWIELWNKLQSLYPNQKGTASSPLPVFIYDIRGNIVSTGALWREMGTQRSKLGNFHAVATFNMS